MYMYTYICTYKGPSWWSNPAALEDVDPNVGRAPALAHRVDPGWEAKVILLLLLLLLQLSVLLYIYIYTYRCT